MQIGIDVGATKIESVILEDSGREQHRSRTACPKEYNQILKTVKEINDRLEKTFNKSLPIGVCHPGIHSPQTGLIKNAPNCLWLEKKPFQKDLRALLDKEVFCENDANCFALSESIDGAGKNHKIVYGIILGSGVGGGLVVDKKIVSGPMVLQENGDIISFHFWLQLKKVLKVKSIEIVKLKVSFQDFLWQKDLIKDTPETLKQMIYLSFIENII